MNGVCKDTTFLEPRYLPIANNVQLCARRDKSLSFLTSARPVNENQKWVCKDKEYTQLCGDPVVSKESEGRLVCIRAGSRCPVT